MLLNFGSGSAFHSIADPDPVSKNSADPWGSGSATLHAGQQKIEAETHEPSFVEI